MTDGQLIQPCQTLVDSAMNEERGLGARERRKWSRHFLCANGDNDRRDAEHREYSIACPSACSNR